MRGRYRNVPGNGFRPNATGPGNAGATSRISNEGSFKGLRMNNYEHRNHSRGNYGRGRGGGGHVKHFQPPPRETNVFVEAGKLAAEYLVSKGVLPPNALSGKIPFDDLRNLLNNSGFKPREASNSQIHGDVRGSSRSRLGSSGLNQGREMRDNSEENNYNAARNFVRGGKSLGSLERNDSEANKLEGRLSLAEKDTASLTVADADNATVANDEREHQENEHVNSGIEKLSPRELEPKVNESDKKYELEKSDAVDGQDAGSSSNSVNNKGGLSITSVDAADKLRDDGMSVEARNNNEMCQKDGKAIKDTSSSGDGAEGDVDLAKECKFTNLPTKTRSSRKFKNSKREQQTSNGGAQNVSKGKVSKVPEVIDLDTGTSSGNASPLQINDQKILQPDALKDPKLELGEGVTLIARPGHHLRSNSFPERSLLKDKKPGEELSRFASFNAGISEKDGKRALGDETDQKEGFKRLKESDGHPRSYSSIDNQPTSDEPKASSNAQGSQGCFDVSLYPRDQADSSGFMQERLLFPGSFKNLDLNLTGTSDHGANSRTIVPSLTLTQKEPKPVDMEFSTSNNSNLLNKTGVARNNIEIIDLENDFAEEDKTFGNPDKRGDPIFTDLDGFPSNVHNANEMPDVAQDGYGLMISELLRNEGPSCSSVPQDLNSLHSLSNPEGILGDDESIYMSLDEIPLSLLGPWEQPGHDYGKPF